jgi:chromosome segregation ATPase
VSKQQLQAVEQSRDQLQSKITQLTTRISKARDLLLNGNLDPDDYQQVKITGEAQIRKLQAELEQLPDPGEKLGVLLNRYKSSLLDLAGAWQAAAADDQHYLLRYLFPHNVIFTHNGFPKAALSAVIRLVYREARL